MLNPLLEVQDLTAGYIPDLPILKGVELRVMKNTITVLIGPNGAGKSTLIKSIAGLLPCSSGKVILNGRDITNIRPDQMARNGISYVPQTDNIFRTLTIRQNLELALKNSRSTEGPDLQDLFSQFPPLDRLQKQKAGALSGGQRQFLAVAMALAVNPTLILMDEPSAGLSPKAAQEVLEMARELTTKGVTILLVEQNVKQALRLSDHCYILADGQNQLDGAAADLLTDPIVGEIYLGGKRMNTA